MSRTRLAAYNCQSRVAAFLSGEVGHPVLPGGEVEQVGSVLALAHGAQGREDLPHGRELPEHLPPAPGPPARLAHPPRLPARAVAPAHHDASVPACTMAPHLNKPAPAQNAARAERFVARHQAQEYATNVSVNMTVLRCGQSAAH
jgi:hypothetical protein